MKVLYLNSLYPPHVGGGAEIALAGMVEGFRARGQDVTVLTTHGGAGVVRDTVQGVPVVRVGSKNIYWHFPLRNRPAWARTLWHALDSCNLPMAHQVGRVIDEIKPDLMVCHNLPGLSAAVWACAESRGIPVVQVLHDYYNLCPKVSMFKEGAACAGPCTSCSVFRLPHKAASKAVTAVVGVSRAVLDTHLANGLFVDAKFKSVVYNARELPPPPPRSVGSVFTFGYIGALSEVKGVQQLAQAFERLLVRGGRRARLLIAGSGRPDEVARLQQEHGSERVQFVGRVDAAAFYAQIDVCVVPSLWNEPLGMVVFEALAAGVPVIGSRRGGIPEMVQHGVNGLLFEPNEAGALEASMARLMDDPELLQSMRLAGRPSVARFLDPQRMLGEYEAIYRHVLEGARAGVAMPLAVPATSAAPSIPPSAATHHGRAPVGID